MSDAKQCDRCFGFFKAAPEYRVKTKIMRIQDDNETFKEDDLCSGCQEELDAFAAGKKEKPARKQWSKAAREAAAERMRNPERMKALQEGRQKYVLHKSGKYKIRADLAKKGPKPHNDI